MSLFVWHFGTGRHYPDVAHHAIALGPRECELLTDIAGLGAVRVLRARRRCGRRDR